MRLPRLAALAAAAMLVFAPIAVLDAAPVYAQAAQTLPTGPVAVVVPANDNTTVVVPASDASAFVVPYGSWLDVALANAGEIVVALLGLLLAWAARRAPKWLADIIRTGLIEQLLGRAVTYGINAVRGAARDRELSVNVGSPVVAEAAQYAIDHGPERLIKWAGGAAGIKEKILARIPARGGGDGRRGPRGLTTRHRGIARGQALASDCRLHPRPDLRPAVRRRPPNARKSRRLTMSSRMTWTGSTPRPSDPHGALERLRARRLAEAAAKRRADGGGH